MRTCPYCGAQLPEEASFCPVCANSLIEKETPALEKSSRRRKRVLIGGALLTLAVILLLVLVIFPGEKVYDDGGKAEVIYESGGNRYHLVLRSSTSDLMHWREPQTEYVRKTPAGQQFAVPLQLYIYDEDSRQNAREDFRKLVAESKVEIHVETGNPEIEPGIPAYREGFPEAMQEADIVIIAQECEATAEWTLILTNGDELHLHVRIAISLYPELSFSYQTTPLSTLSEVQALLDSLEEELKEESNITITLAPTEYEGDLRVSVYNLTMLGSEENGSSSTLKGSLLVDAKPDGMAGFEGITFEGDGSGTGILCKSPVALSGCTIEGYAAGIKVEDGGLAAVDHSAIANCGTGIHYDSRECKVQADFIWACSFSGNEKAILFEHLPHPEVFYLLENTFEENQADVENLTDVTLKDTY